MKLYAELRRFASRFLPATKHDVEKILEKLNMNQQEALAALTAIKAQIAKVAKEQSDRFDALTKTIADLNAVIAGGGDVKPEVVQALADVQTALQALDDTIPDAPVPSP